MCKPRICEQIKCSAVQNFKNQSIFGNDVDSEKVRRFFETQCTVYYNKCSTKALAAGNFIAVIIALFCRTCSVTC